MNNSRIEELISEFESKPYMLKMGAGSLAKRLKCTKDDIYKIKEIVKHNESIPEPKEVKGVLKSRWQSAGGEWRESYKFDNKTSDTLAKFKSSFLGELADLGEVKTSKPNYHNNLLEISLPDYHFGKVSGETLEEQSVEFVKAGLALYKQVKTLGINKIILPIGNDFFNSEATGFTTKGTPQSNNAEYHKVFSTGWKSIIQLVNQLAEEAPVDIVLIPGNHDESSTIMLGEVLEAYYHSDKRVSIDNGPDQTKYYKFGENFFLYNHGDKIKGDDLPLRMAVDKPIEFADSTFRFVRLGHFHKQMHNEVMGIEITYMPSLCKQDKWHKDSNYISTPKATAIVYDKNKGKHTTVNVYAKFI